MPNFRTWIEINEQALVSNVNTLRSLLNRECRFNAVVKANAYGHGLEKVVSVLRRSGIDAFAVDNVNEALIVRQMMSEALILVLGYTLDSQLEEAVTANLHLTVYDSLRINRLEEIASKKSTKAHVHLKIETGTSRQGVLISDLPKIIFALQNSPHVSIDGISTHFANIEDTKDSSYASQQLETFQTACEIINQANLSPTLIHCASSAATILYPDTHGTMVRNGIATYGLWPSEGVELATHKHQLGCSLTPVLSWKTRIAQVKSLPAGTPISYGLTERLKRNSRVAILPVGYSDGYDRRLSSVGETIVGGQRCKVLGRVCMNMMIIDVSNVPKVEREQEVILIGRSGRHEISAEYLADLSQTINYEIVSRINPTLPRILV